MKDEEAVKKVLVLLNDVDPLLNRVTKNKLEKEMGWECIIAVSYDQALTAFDDQNPDAVITEILILDYKNRNGISLIADLRAKEKKAKKVPIVIFSEMDGDHIFEEALESGATACFSKNKMSLNSLMSELEKIVK
jgi:DNA-binding response OmpR family regulator